MPETQQAIRRRAISPREIPLPSVMVLLKEVAGRLRICGTVSKKSPPGNF